MLSPEIFVLFSDQGWGGTGDSKIVLEVHDPVHHDTHARSTFVVTHQLKTIKKVFQEDSELIQHTGTGLVLRLVMVSGADQGMQI